MGWHLLIIPAIDLKEGECVRLRKGDINESTVFSDDPVTMARHWAQQGARRLHIVDLDGAFAGKPKNVAVITEIVKALPTVSIQMGGGIRSLETISRYLNMGIRFVIIGTMAAREPKFVAQACKDFPDQIIVGIDARKGRVAVEGWASQSELEATELAKRFADVGVNAVIFTDIERDGMMGGVNVQYTAALAKASGLPVIASGGVSHIEDIRSLLQHANSGIFGAITGRAIYEGSLDFAAAQAMADAFQSTE